VKGTKEETAIDQNFILKKKTIFQMKNITKLFLDIRSPPRQSRLFKESRPNPVLPSRLGSIYKNKRKRGLVKRRSWVSMTKKFSLIWMRSRA
jgi:hypothetical protein